MIKANSFWDFDKVGIFNNPKVEKAQKYDNSEVKKSYVGSGNKYLRALAFDIK